MEEALAVPTLATCEAVIERGLQTFIEVGEALLAIREGRLYRQTEWKTFEEYCWERWGLKEGRAYQLMNAAEVVSGLKSSTTVQLLPANERQARPLVGLAPEEQVEAWNEVVATAADRGITAQEVKRVVSRLQQQRRNRPEIPDTPPAPRAPVSERFQVGLADPPWRYAYALDSADQVESHYPTMLTEQIAALPIADLFASDAVLFLWATVPKLPDALQVMAAWGFAYKTGAVWIKNGLGMGHYFRLNHELLLIGTRGAPGVPDYAARPASDIYANKGRHSEKPEAVRGYIEAMYPKARRIELFARGDCAGWTSWGQEVPA